jgi:hypothetical protein
MRKSCNQRGRLRTLRRGPSIGERDGKRFRPQSKAHKPPGPPLSRLRRESEPLLIRCQNLSAVRWRDDQAGLFSLSLFCCPISHFSPLEGWHISVSVCVTKTARTPGNCNGVWHKAFRGMARFTRSPCSIITNTKTWCSLARSADVTVRSSVQAHEYCVCFFHRCPLRACWFRRRPPTSAPRAQ